MARKTKPATTPTPTPAEAPAPTLSATAVFVKPEPVTPKNRKGSSTVANPVGVTWVECLNATAGNGGNLPARRVLHKAAIDAGVTYYTARTQVHKFIKWAKAGADHLTLPRGVKLG